MTSAIDKKTRRDMYAQYIVLNMHHNYIQIPTAESTDLDRRPEKEWQETYQHQAITTT